LDAARKVVRLDAELEAGLGVEVAVLDVAVVQDDAELLCFGAIDELGAEVVDAMSLRLPVDEGSVEVEVVGDALGVVRGPKDRVTATVEGLGAPVGLSVVRVDVREALHRLLVADAGASLQDEAVRHLQHEVAAAESSLSGHAEGLDRADLVDPAARGEV